MKIRNCCFAALILLVASSVQAGLVTNVTSSNNSVATVTGVSGISHSGSFATGTISVDLEVFKIHTPIQLNFSYGNGGGDNTTNYTVTLNVKNSIADLGQSLDFNGFDLTRNASATGGITSSGILQTVAPTSTVFGIEYAGAFNITNGFRWGGINGGGPRLAPGGVAVNTFVYRVTWDGVTTGGTSALNFVANPEPTTLLLGTLVMAPAAWVIRRRRKAAAELESAPV